jgi:hypothetical protein
LVGHGIVHSSSACLPLSLRPGGTAVSGSAWYLWNFYFLPEKIIEDSGRKATSTSIWLLSKL